MQASEVSTTPPATNHLEQAKESARSSADHLKKSGMEAGKSAADGVDAGIEGGKGLYHASKNFAYGAGRGAKNAAFGLGRGLKNAGGSVASNNWYYPKVASNGAMQGIRGVTTEHPWASNKSMLGCLAGAALSAAIIYGSVVFDFTIEVFAGWLLHDLLVPLAAAFLAAFLVKALIRFFSAARDVAPEVGEKVDRAASKAKNVAKDVVRSSEPNVEPVLSKSNLSVVLQGAETDLRATQEKRDKLVAEVEAKEHGVALLQAFTDSESKYEEATAQLQKMTEELNTARAELESKKSELNTASAELESKKSEVNTARAQLESKESELNSTKTELNSTNSRLTTTTEELLHLRKRASDLSKVTQDAKDLFALSTKLGTHLEEAKASETITRTTSTSVEQTSASNTDRSSPVEKQAV